MNMTGLSTKIPVAAVASILSLGLLAAPAAAHHSFAMYDQTKVLTFTGVVTRFVAQPNHAEIHFVPLGKDGKPMRDAGGKFIPWGVEMAGAAAVATEGITVTSFVPGTIFSVNVNPLRDGKNFGSRTGMIYKCPKDTPPAAGKHCNSVQGSTQHGRGEFRE
jgi:hypothetical protein